MDRFMVYGMRKYDDTVHYFDTLEEAQKCYDEMTTDEKKFGCYEQVTISVIICEK